MGSSTTTTYHCDKCKKKLRTCSNTLDIVTSLCERAFWSRLHVRIVHIHGMHNDATTEKADLCRECTIELLTDALNRVKKGERATKGAESIYEETWE